MVRVEPPKHRATIRQDIGGLVISIPARRNWILILFLPAWLIGWSLGAVNLIETARRAGWGPQHLMAPIWIGVGLWAIYYWLWNLVGKEIVTVAPTTLSVRREVLGLGRSKEFDLTQINELRVQSFFNLYRGYWESWWGGCPIAFDYGAKTYRFGASGSSSPAPNL